MHNHVDKLSDVLMQPWLCRPCFETLRSLVTKLVEALHQYAVYLESHSARMLRVHRSPEPVRSADQNVSVIRVEGPTKLQYTELEEVLSSMEIYDPLFLNLSPEDRYQRRHWMDNIHVQFPIIMYMGLV